MPQINSRNINSNATRVSLKPTNRGGLKPVNNNTNNSNNANIKLSVNQNNGRDKERAVLKDLACKNEKPALKMQAKSTLNDKANAENQIVDMNKGKRISLKANAKNVTENATTKPVFGTKKVANNNIKVAKKSLKDNVSDNKLVNKQADKIKSNANNAGNGLDFVIFCDENDQLAVTAVEKEQKPSNVGAAEIVLDKENLQAMEFKKTVLQDKKAAAVPLKNNIKAEAKKIVEVKNQQNANQRKPLEPKVVGEQPKLKVQNNQQNIQQNKLQNKQPNVQNKIDQSKAPLGQTKLAVKPQVQTSSQQQVQNKITTQVEIKKAMQVEVILTPEPMEEDDTKGDSLIIESLKLDETIVTDMTLDDSAIEEINKENDPSLMSLDALNSTVESASVSFAAYQMETYSVYSHDVYMYLLYRERLFMPDALYMNRQTEINSKMRAMLIDWMVDVALSYKLESETLFLAVNYIDRFLTSMTISLTNFQLLGIASLLIASKYEEIYPPEIEELIYITDDTYTRRQMLIMETELLKLLNFEISVPTSIYFLKKFLCEMSLPSNVEYFTEFMCYLTLVQLDPFIHFTPSDIAICCILYAIHVFDISELVYLDDFKAYAASHLYFNEKGEICNAKATLMRQNCLDALHYMHRNAASYPYKAVYQKYMQDIHDLVSQVPAPEQAPILGKMFA